MGFRIGFLLCGVIGLGAAVIWSFGRETLEKEEIHKPTEVEK